MKEILIQGWNTGFNKVETTKLLNEELGYSLSDAKEITDNILENKKTLIRVPDGVNDKTQS